MTISKSQFECCQYEPLMKPLPLKEQIWPEGTLPLVSICCAAYNQADYIVEAIESFLSQETVFPVEILIHDDASNDGTTDIVLGYQKKYPSFVRVFTQTENQYSKGFRPGPYLRAQSAADYLAICEGDDYWTSNDKLQKQIEILDKDQTLSACFHNVKQVNEDGVRRPCLFNQQPVKSRTSIRDLLLKPWYIPTCSLVFRRENSLQQTWMNGAISGDYALFLRLGLQGDFYYLNEVMGAYRHHAGGVSKSGDMDWPARWWASYISMMNGFMSQTSSAFTREVAIAIKQELNHHLIGVVALLGSFSGKETPEEYIGRYYGAIDERFKYLPDDDRLKLSRIADIKHRLADCLVDCGNKLFSGGQFRQARAYYIAASRYRIMSLKNWVYWVSTYVPIVRNAFGKVCSLVRA